MCTPLSPLGAKTTLDTHGVLHDPQLYLQVSLSLSPYKSSLGGGMENEMLGKHLGGLFHQYIYERSNFLIYNPREGSWVLRYYCCSIWIFVSAKSNCGYTKLLCMRIKFNYSQFFTWSST